MLWQMRSGWLIGAIPFSAQGQCQEVRAISLAQVWEKDH
jgi:hypothetical protein